MTFPRLAIWNPAEQAPVPSFAAAAIPTAEALRAWDQWARQADASRRPLATFGRIAFLGDAAGFFSLVGPRIVQALQAQAVLGASVQVGALVGRVSDAKQQRLEALWGAEHHGRTHQWPVADAVRAAPTVPSLVIDCNDTLAGLGFRAPLRAAGWWVIDAVQMMEALGLAHTYVPLHDERQSFRDQLPEFAEVFAWCTDALSRDTLHARLQAIIALDRQGLLTVAQPFGLFTRASDSRAALCVGATDVYVDVGAAHGDTVAEFVQATAGQYGAIHAFEPDPVHVRALQLLCSVVPRAQAHACGVGDESGRLEFQEAPENRFGSHFVAARAADGLPSSPEGAPPAALLPVHVPVVRLDDAVTHADLIKIDVEGFEAQVLRGAGRLIASDRPSLHISGYHGPRDLPALTRLLQERHGYRHRVLRHYGGSLYDTNLLVSDRQAFAVGR